MQGPSQLESVREAQYKYCSSSPSTLTFSPTTNNSHHFHPFLLTQPQPTFNQPTTKLRCGVRETRKEGYRSSRRLRDSSQALVRLKKPWTPILEQKAARLGTRMITTTPTTTLLSSNPPMERSSV